MHPLDSLHGQCPIQATNDIEASFRVLPGYRRAHARGECYEAVFRSNGQAAPWTTAPHLQAVDSAAIVRFSQSSPDPAQSDVMSLVKGMAVQFKQPDGMVSNFVGVTLPVFFARTPASFMDLIGDYRRAKSGELTIADMIKDMAEHFAEGKNSLLAAGHLLPPLSYATCRYYGIHTFLLRDQDDHLQPVKFEWQPDAGVHTVPLSGFTELPQQYMADEMAQRLAREEVSFRLHIVLGEEGDPLDDPTTRWPNSRRRIEAGQLSILRSVDEPHDLFMDPARVSQGIELTDDPILHFRSAVYAESWRRRTDRG